MDLNNIIIIIIVKYLLFNIYNKDNLDSNSKYEIDQI